MSLSNTVRLILDVRELRLGEALTALKVPFTMANLDVGDVLIQNAEGEPLLVAERKTHADFAASNADGRYREQRARLMAVKGSGVAVVYILEGSWTEMEAKVYGRTNEAQLKRLTTRLALRYGLPILAADSILDTARWCRVLVAQLTDDATVFTAEASSTDAMASFTAALNTVKKGNRTAGGTAHAMLSAIPGLGGKRIDGILAEKSILELTTMSAAELAGIVVGGRKLGAALGTSLYESFRSKQVATV